MKNATNQGSGELLISSVYHKSKCRGGGTGCAGCAIAHPSFHKVAISIPAFSRKKNFENPSNFDQVRGKNVNCAPIFQQLPPPLKCMC